MTPQSFVMLIVVCMCLFHGFCQGRLGETVGYMAIGSLVAWSDCGFSITFGKNKNEKTRLVDHNRGGSVGVILDLDARNTVRKKGRE